MDVAPSVVLILALTACMSNGPAVAVRAPRQAPAVPLDSPADRGVFCARVVKADALMGPIAERLVVRGTAPAQRKRSARRRDHVSVLVLEHNLAFDER